MNRKMRRYCKSSVGFIICVIIISVIYFGDFKKKEVLEINQNWKSQFVDDNEVILDSFPYYNVHKKKDVDVKINTHFVDLEKENELKRRKVFDYIHKLKNTNINEKLKRLLCNIEMKCKKLFIEKDSSWSRHLFGPFKPQIISYINPNPKKVEMPEIGNGIVGYRALSKKLQVSYIFTGTSYKRRANIPIWNFRLVNMIKCDNVPLKIEGTRVEIDMSVGIMSYLIVAANIIVQQRVYAHKTLETLVVHEVEIFSKDSYSGNIKRLEIEFSKETVVDLTSDVDGNYKIIESNSKYETLRRLETFSKESEEQQTVYIYHHQLPHRLDVHLSKFVVKHVFLLAVGDNLSLVWSQFNEGKQLIENRNELLSIHKLAWKINWEQHGIYLIDNFGKHDVHLISAQYYMMINLPSNNTNSSWLIPTIGLGSIGDFSDVLGYENNGLPDYNRDFWMMNYPKFMHISSFTNIVRNKIKQMKAAKLNAQYFSYNGLRYPILSTANGRELLLKPFYKDIHFPTGLVSLLIKHYLFTTNDYMLFRNMTDFFMEINAYWASLLKGPTKQQETYILESVGPSTKSKVVNSVFNIGLMKESLQILAVLYQYFDDVNPPDKEMINYLLVIQNLTDSLSLLSDSTYNYNPPYYDFDMRSDKLAYPDGLLLRYTLDNMVDSDLGEKNFNMYLDKISVNYSAMTVAAFIVTAIENDKFTKLQLLWKKMKTFAKLPYLKWSSQNRFRGNTVYNSGTYLPAAASYIDVTLCGLMGLKLRRSGLYLRPIMMLNMSQIVLSNLYYLGNYIRVRVNKNGTELQLISRTKSYNELAVMNLVTRKTVGFGGNLVKFPHGSKIVIKKAVLKSRPQ